MNIECVRDKLVEAVAKAEKITGKNLTLPVLSCILLEAHNRELIIRATNLDLGIEIRIPVKILAEGKVAVPGPVLNNFLSHISQDKTVCIETIDGNVKITTSSNTAVIKSMPADDFPTIPLIEHEKSLQIASKDLIRGIKSVWYSCATSSMKPELSSVYIYSDDDGLVFVATDSFRLAEKKVKTKHKDISSLLIPVKNIPEILRVLESCPGDVDIKMNKNQISFTYNGVYLTSRVVDGVFPDYKQIIPKQPKTTTTVLKQDLMNSLKLATLFSDKFNKLFVQAHPSEKILEVSTKNSDVGENTNRLEAVCEGEDIDINFNYKYIIDCFQSIESDSITLEFNGLAKALVIRGTNDKSFMYLVMPINK